jgi:hypothetical protein
MAEQAAYPISCSSSLARRRCMPPAETASFLLAGPDAVGRCIAHTQGLLARLPADSLVELAQYLDPGRPAVRAVYQRCA